MKQLGLILLLISVVIYPHALARVTRGAPPSDAAGPHEPVSDRNESKDNDDKSDETPACRSAGVELYGATATTPKGGFSQTWAQEMVGGDLVVKSLRDYREKLATVPVAIHAENFLGEQIDNVELGKDFIEGSRAGNPGTPEADLPAKALGTGLANLVTKRGPNGSVIGIGPQASFVSLIANDGGRDVAKEVVQTQPKIVLYEGHDLKAIRQIKSSRIVVTSAGRDFPRRVSEEKQAAANDNPPAIVVGGVSPIGFADGMTPEGGEDGITISAPGVGTYAADGTRDGVIIPDKNLKRTETIDGEGVHYHSWREKPILRPQSTNQAAAALVTAALSNVMALIPDLKPTEAKLLLQKTATPGPGTSILNAYKLFEVAKRLVGKNAEQRKAAIAGDGDGPGLFDFKDEAEKAVATAEKLKKDCPEESASFYRRAFLLDPTGDAGVAARKALVAHYSAPGRPAGNADYYKNFDPKLRKDVIKKYLPDIALRNLNAVSAARGLTTLPIPPPAGDEKDYLELGRVALVSGTSAPIDEPGAVFLGSLGEPGKKLLREQFKAGRHAAILGLEEEAKPLLADLLSQTNKMEAHQYRQIFDLAPRLGEVGVDFLRDIAQQPQSYFRRRVTDAIGQLEPEEAVKVLNGYVLDAKYPDGQPAASGLTYALMRWPESPQVLDLVDQVLAKAAKGPGSDQPRYEVMQAALDSLRRLKTGDVDKLLEKYGSAILGGYRFGNDEEGVGAGSNLAALHDQMRRAVIRTVAYLSPEKQRTLGARLLTSALGEPEAPERSFSNLGGVLDVARGLDAVTGKQVFGVAAGHADPSVRQTAAEAIGKVPADLAKHYVPILRTMMSNPKEEDNSVRRAIAGAVVDLAKKNVPLSAFGPNLKTYLKKELKLSEQELRTEVPSLFN